MQQREKHDPFASVRGARMGDLSTEDQDLAHELWMRENVAAMQPHYREGMQRLFNVIDRLRLLPANEMAHARDLDLSTIPGEVPGHGLPDWPEDLTTFRERSAYQKGIGHARAIARVQPSPFQDALSGSPNSMLAPEGFVPMPMDPTQEMAKAGHYRYCEEFVKDYKAMMASIPQPGESSAPVGFVWAPAEPTPQMAKAGHYRYCEEFVKDYKAMVSGAPRPETLSEAPKQIEVAPAVDHMVEKVRNWLGDGCDPKDTPRAAIAGLATLAKEFAGMMSDDVPASPLKRRQTTPRP